MEAAWRAEEERRRGRKVGRGRWERIWCRRGRGRVRRVGWGVRGQGGVSV